MQTILVTGAAGFIGANLILNLLKRDKTEAVRLVGIDSLNDYYDISLKRYRLNEIKRAAEGASENASWIFIHGSIADKSLVGSLYFRNTDRMLW